MNKFGLSVCLACTILLSGGLAACNDVETNEQITTDQFPQSVQDEESKLDARVSEFENAFLNNDMSKIVDFIPPKVLKRILSENNTTTAQLKISMDEMWKATLENVAIEKVKLDRSQNNIEVLENGRPYKVILTTLIMSLKDEPSTLITAKSETLAFFDAGEWYIVRLDEPAQIKMFKDEYPDLAKLNLMAPEMIKEKR